MQITLGTGNLSASSGGNVPGVSLLDIEGQSIGGVFGSSHIEPQGTRFLFQLSPTKPLAMSLRNTNGGDDAICVAAVDVTFPTGQQTAFMTNIGVTYGADGIQVCQSFWLANCNPAVFGLTEMAW